MRRGWLSATGRQFGDHIPFHHAIGDEGVHHPQTDAGWPRCSPDPSAEEIEDMELDALRFYQAAAERATNPGRDANSCWIWQQRSRTHEDMASHLVGKVWTKRGGLARENDSQQRRFVLQIVQPGLAGLMDGSVSTLAPMFAAAFATKDSWDARFWWAWRRRSVRASAWALRRRYRTTE